MSLRIRTLAALTAVLIVNTAQAQTHDHSSHAAKPPPAAQHDEDHSTMDHGKQGRDKTDHAGMDHSSMDHSKVDHSGMDQPKMDHSKMGHPQPASASSDTPRTPIPPLTNADLAAAQAPAHGHAHGSEVFTYLQFNRLETWDAKPGSGQAWEAQGWVGTDLHKLWLRSEGERVHGQTESADLEVLYGRPVSRWWDVVAGVRHDFAPGADQTYAAIGVTGMAPYKFEIEATAYVGTSGQTAARIEAEYELLFTNRLILQPLVEAEWHGKDDASRGIGAGLGKIEAGLRLRYEITRRFAPYVGVVHERSFGKTADFRRDDDEATRDTRVVAGVRLWF